MGCRAESPHFEEVMAAVSDERLAVLDVFLKQKKEKVARFVGKHPHPFRRVRDPEGAAFEAFGFKMTPLVVVIDAEGRLAYRGGRTDAKELIAIVERCLAEAPDPSGAANDGGPDPMADQ